ncbi:MAG: xanthine dehydrogenase family protein subunit M [Pseudomonadota bacterium]
MRYEAPKTLEQAIKLLSSANGQARILAGGTDLLIQLRSGRVEPELVVDVKGIPEMRSISEEDGRYRFGAAVTCMEMIENQAFAQAWPGVVDGAKYIGSVQVKGRATLGGNLCNASPAADGVPALIAAGAVVCISGPNGRRESPVEDFLLGPGQTSLANGELLVSILLPRREPRSGDAYLRFTPRTEMDIAVVGAAVNLSLDQKGICTRARVSLGAVAERTLLVPVAAAALIGTRVDEAALQRLAAAASAACRPIDDKRGTKEFRIKVAGVLAQRAAAIAMGRARSSN